MKRILLVRHAECEMNLHTKGFVGGQSNSSPLTQLGRQQAAALGKHLSKLHACLHSPVYCSTAVRAADTAHIMLQQWQEGTASVPVVSTPQLLELSQGQWEGQPRSQCYTPETLEQIAADPLCFAPPGGESQQQLELRMCEFMHRTLLPSMCYEGPPAVVVTHGLAIKCFLRSILGSTPSMTWKIATDNTSITEVAWARTGPAAGWHLCKLNDTAHLVMEGLPGKLEERPAPAGQDQALQN